MKIIILGPPLAGKGTQGQLLSENLHVPRLSVGALIRKFYNDKKPEGIKASKFMLKGEAIPGDLLISILHPWFLNHTKGFVVDNLIRTKDQLRAFKEYSQKHNFKIDKVINLTMSKDEIHRRLKTRIAEHKKSNKLRPDETASALETRINVYKKDIDEILKYFKKEGALIELSGNHSVKRVYEDIIERLKIRGNGDC